MITTAAALLVCGSSSIVYLATWLRVGRLALHLRGICAAGRFLGVGVIDLLCEAERMVLFVLTCTSTLCYDFFCVMMQNHRRGLSIV
jgi:hypothetical protein